MAVDPNVVIGAVTAGGAIASFVWGIHTFQKGNNDSKELKKKAVLTDIMFPLITEYNNSKSMELAMEILDDKPFQLSRPFLTTSDDPPPKYADYLIYKENLAVALRNHEELETTGEEDIVRDSFDELLTFLAKLEYVVRIGLVKREDLTLFEYFINKAAENIGVRNFVRIYKHPLSGILDDRLNRGLPLELIENES